MTVIPFNPDPVLLGRYCSGYTGANRIGTNAVFMLLCANGSHLLVNRMRTFGLPQCQVVIGILILYKKVLP